MSPTTEQNNTMSPNSPDLHTTLLFTRHGSVCGCPQFWGLPLTSASPSLSQPYDPHSHCPYSLSLPSLEPGPTAHQLTPSTTTHTHTHAPTTPPAAPSTSLSPPPREIKETCFFWYHAGTCRRGTACDRPHEMNINWPITAPPGYVHRVPCHLQLCPLRQDLVMMQRLGEAETAVVKEVDADAEMSQGEVWRERERCVEEDALVEREVEADIRRIEGEVWREIGRSAEEGMGEVGTEVESSKGWDEDSESDSESEDSSSDEDTSDIVVNDIADVVSSSASSLTPTPPATPLMSISHAGTLNRKRGPAHRHDNPNAKKRPRLRSPTRTPPTDQTHDLPAKPTVIPTAPNAALHQRPALLRPPQAPKVPTDRLGICFYWYHQGWCTPRRNRHGYMPQCKYLHEIVPGEKVSWPPGIRHHDPRCGLPLCPIVGGRKERVRKVLVNYELPGGEERAEWDTDALRHAFGEIE